MHQLPLPLPDQALADYRNASAVFRSRHPLGLFQPFTQRWVASLVIGWGVR